ncbi:MAG: IclR family transcriptional regulator [Clostridiales Family XIII bacterium]|nr:IclR family transcriptional regulator [Clostridiales Family XIII bacterium]
MNDTQPDGVKNKSLYKAITVLDCFIEKQPLGVTEISKRLGLTKSNVHNILSTLVAADYVEQDGPTGKYSIGSGVFRLYRALGDRFSLSRIASPFMKELANLAGCAVFFTIPHMEDVIYIGGEYPDRLISFARVSDVGNNEKMYCTSSGKIMLAYMDPEKRKQCLPSELTPCTEYTITDLDQLNDQLEEFRQQGYAIDDMECELGISCMAAALLDGRGLPFGAICITGPSIQIAKLRTPAITSALIDCAHNIARELNA